jgi:hypothetical protein
MSMVRVKKAVPLTGQRLRLTLTDGRALERDVGPLLVGPVFEPRPSLPPDDAKRFYVKYGFVPLADRHLHLYLPRRMIEDESADNARDE